MFRRKERTHGKKYGEMEWRSKKKEKKATQRKQIISSRDKGIVVDKKKKELAKTKMRTHIYNAPSLWQSAWLFFPS